jgi:catechol 2,3-dioxygenase-like lactoylglutathione lyase family enzyme
MLQFRDDLPSGKEMLGCQVARMEARRHPPPIDTMCAHPHAGACGRTAIQSKLIGLIEARGRGIFMLGPIAHIALTVRDPTRTAVFLRDLFDVPVLRRTDAEGHDETFVRLGVTWCALVGADVKRERTGDHIAFRVARETIPSIAGKLKTKGCEFILSDSGTSLYFFDFDNHVFELDSSDQEQELNRLAASSGA